MSKNCFSFLDLHLKISTKFIKINAYFSNLRLGQGWEDPVHSDPLVEISELTPKTESTSTTMTLKTEENNTTAAGSEPTTPSKQEATSGQEEVTSGQVTSGEEAVSAGSEATSSKPSSLSNEDLAKMYQPKTRPSLAQRLKRK